LAETEGFTYWEPMVPSKKGGEKRNRRRENIVWTCDTLKSSDSQKNHEY